MHYMSKNNPETLVHSCSGADDQNRNIIYLNNMIGLTMRSVT